VKEQYLLTTAVQNMKKIARLLSSMFFNFPTKSIPLSKPKYDMTSPKYKKLTVDKLPIIKIFKKLDYKQLLSEYKTTHGKEQKPVNPRGKNPVDPDTICPKCGALPLWLNPMWIIMITNILITLLLMKLILK